MKKTFRMLGIVLCCYGTPLIAEIEPARDLMEQGHFTEAMQALLPAARAGNADAEELIGVMYAMGLGVEQDDIRAFDWYLRASLKGQHRNSTHRRKQHLQLKYETNLLTSPPVLKHCGPDLGSSLPQVLNGDLPSLHQILLY